MIPEDESETIYYQVWNPTLWADARHKDKSRMKDFHHVIDGKPQMFKNL